MRNIWAIFFTIITTATFGFAATYTWVDEKGTVHFSDRPRSPDAQIVREPSPSAIMPGNSSPVPSRQTPSASVAEQYRALSVSPQAPAPSNVRRSAVITADDYEIRVTAKQLGDEVIFSGRISNGPPCEQLVITLGAHSTEGRQVRTSTVVNMTGVLSRVITASARSRPVARPSWTVSTIVANCN